MDKIVSMDEPDNLFYAAVGLRGIVVETYSYVFASVRVIQNELRGKISSIDIEDIANKEKQELLGNSFDMWEIILNECELTLKALSNLIDFHNSKINELSEEIESSEVMYFRDVAITLLMRVIKRFKAISVEIEHPDYLKLILLYTSGIL